jgi:dihydrofolate reductase
MRTLTYYIAVTLDGFIAGPDGQFDFFPLHDDHQAAIVAEYPETMPGHVRAVLGIDAPNRYFDTVVMGRGTYEPALREGITSPYPHLRQVVFSRSLGASPDPAVEVVASDPVARVRELKAEGGLGIWLCGGGATAGLLWDEIDRFVVKSYPVFAGDGIRLAERGFRPTALRLNDQRVFASGGAISTFERAG